MEVDYKGFKITVGDQGSLWVIKHVGKGSLKLPLRGKFTTVVEAKKRIDSVEAEAKTTKEV